MYVLALIGHPGSSPSSLLALEHGCDYFLPFRGDNSWMVVEDKQPFILILDGEALAAFVSIVVAVGPGVEGIGQHRADGGGIPRFAGSGAYALLVERLGNCSERLHRFVEVIDMQHYLSLVLDDGELLGVLVVGISERDFAAIPYPVISTREHDGADPL